MGFYVSFLQNRKISTKILSVIVPICLIGIGGVAWVSSNYKSANTRYSDFITIDNAATIDLARADRNLNAISAAAYQITLQDPSDAKFQASNQYYRNSTNALKKRLGLAKDNLPGKATEITGFITKADAIIAILDKATAFAGTNADEQAKAELGKADDLILGLSKDIANVITAKTTEIGETSKAIASESDSIIVTSLAALGIVFLFGITAALLIISRGIAGPIHDLRNRMMTLANGETRDNVPGLERKDEIGEMAQAVSVFRDNALERTRLEQEAVANRSLSEQQTIEREAQKAKEAEAIKFAVENLADGLAHLSDGDVSHRIQQPFADGLDRVRMDFNNSAEKLQSTLSRIAGNASGIASGSNEIKSAADDLAKRTEQQAAAVEQTAAALEEITTTVKDSTKRAQDAGALVSRAKAGAEKSGEVVRRAVSAMEQIEKSSSEINNIIGVIDEIAFQTNLLALNAGVEAARAGEAGKGFAVVAQEVRELAQRSASAAKQIKTLITASNTQVQEGVQLVGDTGRALESIVTEVQEINHHVSAIVEAAQEQSSGLQQINTAVNQMDMDTQKNAAMVEQTTAATHSLSQEVSSLNELLTMFKLSGGQRQQAAAPLRAAKGTERPVASPVKALGNKLASAFVGNAAVKQDSWEEF